MRPLLTALLFAFAGCVLSSSGEDVPRAHDPDGPCFIGGCSSQLCTDEEGAVSTCEWTDAYACYRDATCERQVDGACGWTQTPALKECLANP